MRIRPIIQLYSDDAPRHREFSRLGIAIRLSATVLFGAVVYAATEVGQPDHGWRWRYWRSSRLLSPFLLLGVGCSDARPATTDLARRCPALTWR